MRKEVLLAVVIGISLGLLITFGVYQSRRNISDAQKDQVQDVLKNPVLDENEDNSQLAITSPEDNLITDSQRLIVSGNTNANNFVVVFVNNEEMISSADESGNFSKEVRLDQGANVLTIYSINQDGLLNQATRTVIVDADFLNEDFSQSNNDDQEIIEEETAEEETENN
jgi:hypothetical protein